MYKIELVENKAKKYKIYKDVAFWSDKEIFFDEASYNDINCFDYIMVASYIDLMLSSIAMIKEEGKNIAVYIITNSKCNNDIVIIKEIEFVLKLIKKEISNKTIYIKFLKPSELVFNDLEEREFNVYNKDNNVVTYMKKLKD